MDFNTMTVDDRITRAKIQMQKKQPFFAYLLMHLSIREVDDSWFDKLKKELPEIADLVGPFTAGVDNYGNLYYSKKWVKSLSERQLEGVLCHEVMHCLTPESLVITSEGLKPIKKIKTGDLVYSKKGTFTKVLEIGNRYYKGKVYEINPRFGLPATFTGEHPILAVKQKDYKVGWGFQKSLNLEPKRNEKFRFIKTENLEKNDATAITIPKTYRTGNRKLFTTRDKYKREKIFLDEDVAYFLGFFVGDGSLHKVKKGGKWLKFENGKVERHITLTLSFKDDYEKLNGIISKKFHRSPCIINIKDKKARRIIFSGKGLAKFLRNNFYLNNEKAIPRWMVYERENIIRAFIDGLRDADGSICKGRTAISSVHKGVYSLLPLLLLKIGIISGLTKYDRKDGYKSLYKVEYTVNPRRKTAILNGNKFIMPIDEIKIRNYEGKVYNLKTEAQTYCVPFFTTHNCALEHMERTGTRDHQIANIAQDMVVNDIVLSCNEDNYYGSRRNMFDLPECGIIPDEKHEVNLGSVCTVKDVDKKSYEEIYDEIYHKIPKIKISIFIGGSGSGKGQGGFDMHIRRGKGGKNKDKDGEGEGEKEGSCLEGGIQKPQDWKRITTEASIYAKQRGQLPAGMERRIEGLLQSKINWKSLLLKYVTREIPYDYTYSSPHKKSIAAGFYIPNIKRENIEILVSVDTSGSIGQEELTEFLTEIVAMARSFENIRMTLIVCDAEVHNIHTVENGSIEKIMSMQMKGGGGTSHVPVFNWIRENKPMTRVLMALTDGYTEFPKDIPPYTVIWVLSKNSVPATDIPFGVVVKIDD